MNPTLEESLTQGLLVCKQKSARKQKQVECVPYEQFQAALREALLKSPKKGEI